MTAESGDSAAAGAAATPDQLVGSDTPRDPGAADVAGSESTWTHEYVHTRQRYQPDASMAWLDEGSAEYYGYLLSMRAGTTPYSAFRNAVMGDSYAGADLRKPGAWSDPDVEYEKGARVVAALDARIRAETGGGSDGTGATDGGDAGGESDGDAATAADGPTPLGAVLALAAVCGLGRRLLGRRGR